MGYSPSSVVSGASLPNTLAVYYEKLAIAPLLANTPALEATTKRTLPRNSGKTVQLFAYNALVANTTQATEGTVGTGVALTSQDVQATIGQYSDFVSISDVVAETSIDNVIESASLLMGERAALTINSLVFTELDAAITADATCNFVVADGSFLNSSLVRQRVADLQGRNAHGIENGQFVGLISPFVASDLFNDTANNGFTDIIKRNPGLSEKLLLEGTADNLDYEILGSFGGVKWLSTTTVPTYANVPVAGKTAYGSYIVARDGVFAISLGANELPKDKNFKLMTSVFKVPSPADPARQIAAAVAYNVKFVAAIRPGTTQVVERIQSETATT